MSRPPAEFSIVYDLREPGAWRRARRARHYWGVRYTRVDMVDDDHVILTFHPAPDRRWARWEEVRKGWILREAA